MVGSRLSATEGRHHKRKVRGNLGVDGSPHKKWGPDRCVGRSRGGLTTKIHTVVDVTGLPLRFALSPGQAHDSTLAGPFLDDQLPADAFVLADKAYDAEWIGAMIEALDAVPIIPDRRGAKTDLPPSTGPSH